MRLRMAVVTAFVGMAVGLGTADKKQAQSAAPANAVSVPAAEEEPAAVHIDGRTIIEINTAIGGYTAEERAARVQERLQAVAQNTSVPVSSIQSVDEESWSQVKANDFVILWVTEPDAIAAGQDRRKLAAQYAEIFRQTITNYRSRHTWKRFFRSLGMTAIATAVLLLLWYLVVVVHRWMRSRLEDWIARAEERLRQETKIRLRATYLGPPLVVVIGVIRWALILILLQLYLALVLSFFPSTEEVARTLSGWVGSSLASLARQGVDYLPNLLVVAVIVLVAYWITRLNTILFNEVALGRITLRGFYPDWADPTAKLMRALIFVLTAIIIFPYLPGSKSPAFQGISIFLGVLLSLGSSSAVANGIAGLILTYMRSFQISDIVRIGDTVGEVVEKNLLVTRVRTLKEEVVTIPNATVMNGAVINYSAKAVIQGVILHTNVTIGYDAPWRQVHELLIHAALATSHVRKEPKPFVLQKSLDDFFVSYELNVYTDTPRFMLDMYSELHQNIQDRFNEAGVEIMSPHYAQLRDGNPSAIPSEYLPKDYEAPWFRVANRGEGKK